MSYRNPVRSVTATIAGSGGVTGPRVKSGAVSNGALTAPSNVATGDLILFLTSVSSGQTPQVSGPAVTAGDSQTPSTSLWLHSFTRIAQAGDAGQTWTWSVSAGQIAVAMFVISGATAVTRVGGGQVATGTRAAITTPPVGAGVLFVGQVALVNTTPAVDTLAWGNTAEGGPPSPQPAWSSFVGGGYPCRFGVSTSNWSPADSYSASLGGAGAAANVALWRLS